MAHTTILHLSDLHIRHEADNVFDQDVVLNPLIRRVEKDRKKGLAPELLIITGDIAFKGAAEEYAMSAAFLYRLTTALELQGEMPPNVTVD
jgi:3',5'-cyclic AMP phosphodiesterase CpdA